MSSLIINWRFGGWFLQIDHPRHWRHRVANLSRLPDRPLSDERWIAFYQGRRYALALAVLVALLVWWAL